jgi:hypothetical protein
MADNRTILVTGAAGQLGGVGRSVTGLLLGGGVPRVNAITGAGLDVNAPVLRLEWSKGPPQGSLPANGCRSRSHSWRFVPCELRIGESS